MALSDVFQAIQKKLNFTKTAEIDGIVFELGLLTFDEELKSEVMPQENLEPLVYFNQSRLQTLSYAIKAINGEAVTAVVEIKTGDKVEKKQGSLYVKELLNTLPLKLIEHLFDIYVDLKEELDGTIDNSIKYNWFKTPEQREEDEKKRRAGSKDEPSSEESVDSTEDDASDIKFREIPKTPEDEKTEE